MNEIHIEMFRCGRCGRAAPCHGRRMFIEETWESDCCAADQMPPTQTRTVYHCSMELCGHCAALVRNVLDSEVSHA